MKETRGFVKGLIVTGTIIMGALSMFAESAQVHKNYAYTIAKAKKNPVFEKDCWNNKTWKNVKAVELKIYHKHKYENYKPVTKVKLQYGTKGLYGLFKADDKYVKSLQKEHLLRVCDDSCVEFFVQPAPPDTKGVCRYMNLEFNCGGKILTRCNVRDMEGKRAGKPVPFEKADIKKLIIYHSMPETVEKEIEEDVTWYLGFFVPFSIFTKYCGAPAPKPDDVWHGNFYKCGHKTSHPHYVSWAPLAKFTFHLPKSFSTLVFEK